jgi:hypothetical protein
LLVKPVVSFLQALKLRKSNAAASICVFIQLY